MLTVTSVLEREDALKLPEYLCAQWGIEDGVHLHAAMRGKILCLAKTKQARSVATIRVIDSHIILTKNLVEVLGMRRGSHVSLTLEDDTLTLYRSKIIPLHSEASNTEKLMRKLERELESCRISSISMRYQALIEDIYMFLILNKWSEATIESLLEKPYPLRDLIMKLHNDEEFDEFFENKMKELTLSYTTE